ncbi:MAG: 16S rRNA (uracil(1498)-N(3))-methyltransferase [Pleomorphochaeta sp.]
MNIILFEKLEAENLLDMKDERARHIKKILKLKEGDSFSAGVINSKKGIATIIEINKEYIRFSFKENDEEIKKLYPLTLLISYVRPICMKRIFREAISLGVETIVLFNSDTGEKSYARSNFYVKEEYRKVLIDGAMQAAETPISEVKCVKNLNEALKLFDTSYDKVLLDNVIKGDSLKTYTVKNNKTVIAIGPERGFSNRERDLFIDNNFTSFTLGNRVLRSETAACAAITLTLSRMNLI